MHRGITGKRIVHEPRGAFRFPVQHLGANEILTDVHLPLSNESASENTAAFLCGVIIVSPWPCFVLLVWPTGILSNAANHPERKNNWWLALARFCV